jgi:rhodanese-related sulfurtransferase
MRKGYVTYLIAAMALIFAIPAYAVISSDTVEEVSNVLISAPAANHWQVKADEVYGWMQAKKTDFVIVDVRPNPPGQQGGKMPGAIYIPYNEILKAENLKKLPKDKKLILVCVTGQTQNLPLLVLRTMGYDAYTMAFGHAAWIKGYLGANFMQAAIKNAGEKNFPVEE